MTELVLPFVVRIERDDPPARTDALEAAALGVLLMLVEPHPEWAEALEAWDGQRIRKVVRRARGAPWQRAAELPGLDARVRTAEVRVYPPVPVDEWPPELAKLQVGGTTLDDPEPPRTGAAGRPDGAALAARRDDHGQGDGPGRARRPARLARGPGAAARASGTRPASRSRCATRRRGNGPTPSRAGAPVVQDGGFTEVEPGTATALIVLPPA